MGLVIIRLTLYLGTAGAFAINNGIWTINPEKSVDLLLGGVLPVEALLFFLLTNILVTFGSTLVMAQASHARVVKWRGGKVVDDRDARFCVCTGSSAAS